MTDIQKQRLIIRRLLDLTDEHGRGYYPLEPLAGEVGLTVAQLYDNNTNTGLLWDLGRHGRAYIDVQFPDRYDCACINVDCEQDAERFAREPEVSFWGNPPQDVEQIMARATPVPFRNPEEPTFTADQLAAALDHVTKDATEDLRAQVADYEAVLDAIVKAYPKWDESLVVRAGEVLEKWSSILS